MFKKYWDWSCIYLDRNEQWIKIDFLQNNPLDIQHTYLKNLWNSSLNMAWICAIVFLLMFSKFFKSLAPELISSLGNKKKSLWVISDRYIQCKENGISHLSSNPDQGCLHSTSHKCFWKRHESICSPSSYG